MQNYNLNALPSDLTAWMELRFLAPILNIEGGWESWFQIDFPAWLDASRGVQFDFRREVDLGGGRVDWLVNSQLGQSPGIGVELKAQTHKYLTSRFVSDALHDVEKLQGWVQHGRIVKGLAVAVAIDPDAASRLVGEGFVELLTFRDVARFMARIVDGTDSDDDC